MPYGVTTSMYTSTERASSVIRIVFRSESYSTIPRLSSFGCVCLMKRVVDTVANVLRCRRLTGLPFGDGLREIIQGRRTHCALEMFDDLPPAFVAEQVVNLRFSKLWLC